MEKKKSSIKVIKKKSLIKFSSCKDNFQTIGQGLCMELVFSINKISQYRRLKEIQGKIFQQQQSQNLILLINIKIKMLDLIMMDQIQEIIHLKNLKINIVMFKQWGIHKVILI
jgi:hypothetical protein